MGNKGSDSDHVRSEFLHKIQVIQEKICGLSGASHHHSAADLESDLLQVLQTAAAVFNRQLLRMQHSVVQRIDSLMPQKVSVRSRPEISFIALARFFSDGKGHRAVRMSSLNL